MKTLYHEKKGALIFLINHYESMCIEYIKCHTLTIDELEVLWRYDDSMITHYTQELLLLEAKNILNLI
ncbi:MAG: hypothetical protein JWQ09_5838 [Segetibacter sp.]|nr:hypothetical protein [Segetibacter sp.]